MRHARGRWDSAVGGPFIVRRRVRSGRIGRGSPARLVTTDTFSASREAELLVELLQPAPSSPRSCQCSRCQRRLGKDELGVLILAEDATLELFCMDHAPVPLAEKHVSINRCWGCRRALLIDLRLHHPPYCAAACKRRAEAASVAKREQPGAWVAKRSRAA